MSKPGLLRVIATLLISLPATVHPGASEPLTGRLETTSDWLTRLEKLGFAGVVVISADDRPVLAEGYGLADRESATPWNPATVSTIGSITKQFTGAAILRLQEQGKLSVQDPITRYFPNVPQDKQGITLHHLLTHSSGIVDLEDVGDFDPIGREEFIRLALRQDLAFQPGDGYDYSNAGYSLLGAVIEQSSGVSYETFLRRELLIPNGLFETGYLAPIWGQGRLAQGYTEDGPWGTVLERRFAIDGPYWVLRANGGLHSTAYDMLRWAQALMAGRVLSPESLDAYWSPHVDQGGTFYGYGWVVDRIGDQRVITHNGGNGIFFADMAILPDAGLVVFLQTNIRDPLPMVEVMLYEILEQLVIGEPLPRVPVIVEVERSRIDSVVGNYSLEHVGQLDVVAQAGTLVVTPTDPAAFAYLLSTRPVDLDRTARLSARIDSIVGAALGGDLEPLWEAYRRQVTLEYLQRTRAMQMQELEERFGAYQGYEILGTALRTEREVTLVRLHFDNGHSDRAYVWNKDAEEELLGVSRRGLADSLVFHPEGDDRFASWDPRTGESQVLQVDKDEQGHLRLQIGEGDLVTIAVRR